MNNQKEIQKLEAKIRELKKTDEQSQLEALADKLIISSSWGGNEFNGYYYTFDLRNGDSFTLRNRVGINDIYKRGVAILTLFKELGKR